MKEQKKPGGCFHMPAQDTSKTKEKILNTLKSKGPCLPVHIANALETSILFSSAFLSELVSEKKIKISHMKVGSSPLYFIPGQEHLLERFSQYLKSKEKDAFELLKNNDFLVDSKQEPAIRVALRSIKDFAMPFKQNNEIVWRYYTKKAGEFAEEKPITQKKETIKNTKPEEQTDKVDSFSSKEEKKEKQLDIFKEENKQTKKVSEKTKKKKRTRKTATSQRKNEKFFDKVKKFLSKQSIDISDIEGFSRTTLTLKVVDKGVEKLLVAYNKKRITETDLLKAYKKASEDKISYLILSLGNPPKKLENTIKAIKNLSAIRKIE